MRRLVVLVLFGVVGIVGVAQAEKAHPVKTETQSCAPRAERVSAVGTLISASLSPATIGHERFAGTVTIALTRVNHAAASGTASFTLHDARVVFHNGVNAAAPAAGSRVEVHGKITVLGTGCSAAGFTSTSMAYRVSIGSPTIETPKLSTPKLDTPKK